MKPERLAITIVEYIKDGCHPRFDQDSKIWKKLRSLEDIEQELGIDLVTLFKAFRGFWYNKNGEIKFSCHPIIVDDGIYILEESYPQVSGIGLCFKIYFKDYGKTWALAEEELAKGDRK